MKKPIKLNQIFWNKSSETADVPKTFTIPVGIQPEFVMMFIEDEVANKTPIIGEQNIAKCTAIILQNVEQPIMVRETFQEVMDLLSAE